MKYAWFLALWGFWSFLQNTQILSLQALEESRQKEVIAACLVLEAGGEGKTGMQAVMNVITNRAKGGSKGFYLQVVKEKQFSCINSARWGEFLNTQALNANIIGKAKKSPAWKVAVEIVDSAFSGSLSDVTGGATHYYSTKVYKNGHKPDWADAFQQTKVIGRHLFLRDPSCS